MAILTKQTTSTIKRTSSIWGGKRTRIRSVSDNGKNVIDVQAEYKRLDSKPRQPRCAVIRVDDVKIGESRYTPEGNGRGSLQICVILPNGTCKELLGKISKKEWIPMTMQWIRDLMEETAG